VRFDFKVIAKSFPAICLVAGVALFIASLAGLGFEAGFLGVILVFAAIGLYVWKSRRNQ